MFHKQNARQPWAAVLLALLLALASAFSCIGLSGWASFRRQLAALDAQYTTVAYSGNNDIYATIYDPPVKEYLEDGSILFEDGTLRASPQRVERLIGNAPGVLRRDTNVLTAAHTPGLKGMSSGAVDPLAYVAAYDQGRYAQSVAAMRCVDVSQNPGFNAAWQEYYFFFFEWIDPVCRMDAYDLPEHSVILQVVCNQRMCVDEDGNPCPPFEVGKT